MVAEDLQFTKEIRSHDRTLTYYYNQRLEECFRCVLLLYNWDLLVFFFWGGGGGADHLFKTWP